MTTYREYDVTITRTVTARVRVEDTQQEPIMLAQDMGLVLWRLDESRQATSTSTAKARKTSDTHKLVTVVDVTGRPAYPENGEPPGDTWGR